MNEQADTHASSKKKNTAVLGGSSSSTETQAGSLLIMWNPWIHVWVTQEVIYASTQMVLSNYTFSTFGVGGWGQEQSALISRRSERSCSFTEMRPRAENKVLLTLTVCLHVLMLKCGGKYVHILHNNHICAITAFPLMSQNNNLFSTLLPGLFAGKDPSRGLCAGCWSLNEATVTQWRL